MSTQLHTVLGASGSVGLATIGALKANNLPTRAISRSLNIEGVETVAANAFDKTELNTAIKGSSHVYLCLGLPYKASVWKEGWPNLMENVVEACATNDAALIFLDNIYMYGPEPLLKPFAEDHPQFPTTKKGKARKQTADILMKALEEQKVRGLIGRAADFYGPAAINSMLWNPFLMRMLKGKAPQFLGPKNIPHTYGFTGDIGRALVELALDPSTYGQVWHLPVHDALTPQEAADIFNQVLGTDYTVSYMPPVLRKLLALFVPILKEVGEMQYQFEAPYLMSWAKFQEHFPDFELTSFKDGATAMVEYFKNHS